MSLLERLIVPIALAISTTPASPTVSIAAPDPSLPRLTDQPVNDFAHVIDPRSGAAMDAMIRQLKGATGDVVVVVTVPTIEPYGDMREYINKLFENSGRGIGEKGKDNGLLILLALKERKVQIEVGYGLEPYVTDGFAGETIRGYIIPEARNGRYGPGLAAGTARIIAHIADGRNVTLQNVPRPRPAPHGGGITFPFILLIFIAILILSRIGGGPGGRGRRWGITPGGWYSGVGPFGGGFGGGFGSGGGGFGGGFGGFGGGSSGGGGAGGSW